MHRPASLLLLLLGLLAVRRAGAAVRCGAKESGATYSTRYDNVDVDAILNSARLLKSYVDCLMDRGPCTPEGCFLHEVIPDALGNECSKCSEVQKVQAGKILAVLLQDHRKTYWPELLGRYDPDGSFRRNHEFEDDDDDEERRR